jgi:hypothetical protein
VNNNVIDVYAARKHGSTSQPPPRFCSHDRARRQALDGRASLVEVLEEPLEVLRARSTPFYRLEYRLWCAGLSRLQTLHADSS